MRVCIAGGGIAGTLLAWRLASRPEIEHVELLLGDERSSDATEQSGGVVRAYERDPESRRLAARSLAELEASPVLRMWSDYRPAGAVYLRRGDAGLDRELHDLDERVPRSVRLAGVEELVRMGWSGLPADTVGVVERRAGYISPARLRSALLLDLTARPGVRTVRAAAGDLAVRADGAVTATAGSRQRTHDVAVLAAGAWTPALLEANGLPATGLRTKAIRCGIYAVRSRRPAPFADETSGLYGKPTRDGRLLLGIATDEWGVTPGRRPARTADHRTIVRLAEERMPWLRLGGAHGSVDATDCYSDPPVLALRRVAGQDGPIFTFTGGSGGSIKTALAASREAADQLLGVRRLQPAHHGE